MFLNDSFLYGEYKTYYADGKIKERINYKRSVLDGEYILYFPNGTFKMKACYKDGLLHGHKAIYHDNGKIFQYCKYINDKKEGVFQQFDVFQNMSSFASRNS